MFKYPILYSVAANHGSTLLHARRWNNGKWEWKLGWKRNLFVWEKNQVIQLLLLDTNQANKEMTKDAHYHSHYEKSSHQSSENLTNDLADLTRGRNGHKPEHLMIFLLVFLRIKQVVNNLGSL